MILATTPLVSDREPISGAEVRSLIDAAADAGFDGVSIWTAHHDWAVADDMTSEEYFAYHRDRGLRIPSAEVLLEWADTEENRHILDVSAAAGASYVIAATIEPGLPEAAGLATLCDLAAGRGLSISLEFLPFSGLPNIASAVRVLEAADRDNLGLVLDLWHWHRGGPDLETLRSVPPERIHLLQLNDAAPAPGEDLMLESMWRLLPGEGAVDIEAVLETLDELGASPVVVTEVFSVPLVELGPAENARQQYVAATDCLVESRFSLG
jgi:sugar phosphate isomerase/epimerase